MITVHFHAIQPVWPLVLVVVLVTVPVLRMSGITVMDAIIRAKHLVQGSVNQLVKEDVLVNVRIVVIIHVQVHAQCHALQDATGIVLEHALIVALALVLLLA